MVRRSLIVLVALTVLSGCMLNSPPDGTPVTSENTPEVTPPTLEIPIAPGAIGPREYPPNVNPLTGEAVADPAVLNRRPMVVKVSNAPALVRPQAGIGAADLVFEHYAEGGLTRFSAIFYSQAPTRVGSIRSARLIDYELVPMYQALLAYSGASTGVQDKIAHSEFANRAYMGVLYGMPYFWRDENIPVPHNLFMNVDALWQLAAKDGFAQRPDLHGMAFHPDPAVDASALTGDASSVDLRYATTRVNWTYDAPSGLYKRNTDGVPHTDANTGQQVTAANVVVLYAGHYFTDIVESVFQGNASYSIQITVWPKGDAVLFRDGKRFDGRWERETRPDLLSLHTKDGGWLYLKPGNTWFQLVKLPDQQTASAEWLRVQ